MEQKTHSQAFLRKRKLLLVLPLLALPFLTLLFWALGGGSANATTQGAQNGLNMQLPGANLKDDKPLDKLSYYEKAVSDSLKLQQLMENDPYYRRKTDTSILPKRDTALAVNGSDVSVFSSPVVNRNNTYSDPNEAKVYQKLAQLDAALNKASASNGSKPTNAPVVKEAQATTGDSKEIDRLEGMMQGMNQKDSDDPEMQQLDGLLEKIIDIQHPDRLRNKLKQTSEANKGQVFPVVVNSEGMPVSLLEAKSGNNRKKTASTNAQALQNGFYDLDEQPLVKEQPNAIQAVVHGTQTLVNGSTVKLRLLQDVFINGKQIPKDNFLFGTADLNGDRLAVKIKSVRYANSLFPVNLSVCDMDGMDGIYIPGAITRDMAKQSLERTTQAIDFTSLNPSIGAQAAGAGIEAAKTLLGRKVKLVKVTVKAGYQVLLRDEKQKQEAQ